MFLTDQGVNFAIPGTVKTSTNYRDNRVASTDQRTPDLARRSSHRFNLSDQPGGSIHGDPLGSTILEGR